MRHILVILMLALSAWAFLPAAAQAHGAAHDMPATGGCADCIRMAGQDRTDHAPGDACHHGTACAVFGLPAGPACVVPLPALSGEVPLETPLAPRSALVARDLPPPRS